jgi:hypothetical protein
MISRTRKKRSRALSVSIRVAPGTTFYRGTKFMGFDVAEWLEAHVGQTLGS